MLFFHKNILVFWNDAKKFIEVIGAIFQVRFNFGILWSFFSEIGVAEMQVFHQFE